MTTHKNTASRLREIRKNNFIDHAGFSTYESIYRRNFRCKENGDITNDSKKDI